MQELEAALATSPGATGFDRLARLHFEAGREADALEANQGLESFPTTPDLELDSGRTDPRESLAGLLGRAPQPQTR